MSKDSKPSDKPKSNTTAQSNPTPATSPTAASPPASQPSLLNRAFTTENRATAKRFLSAYAETWIGLSPIWLMGEAVIPGKKVGSRFNKGKDKLIDAAREVGQAISTSSKDVVVIVDEKLKESKEQTGKTAEIIKAAGENALMVVTTSLEKVQAEFLNNKELGPQIKQVVSKNGRDVVILVDKALKHPVVITGVTKFAKSKGIPHADALLRLCSLGLAKILKSMPEEVKDSAAVHAIVEELDAAELERSSTHEENAEADRVGKDGKGKAPKVENVPEGQDPYAEMKKRGDCVVM